MLEFFDSDDRVGTVTFYDRHLLLNSKLIKYFEEAYKVRIGLDKELNEVYVFPLDKDHALSGEIKESSLLSLSVSKSYVRIASKQLIEFLSNAFGLVINKGDSIQFKGYFDDKKKCLIIDMGGKKNA
ncbi:MAG: hypothetical protein K6F81_04160 [Acholeplasmatales bacterium]|nr:hypothetical protein [Acholeplasmatales bacterium]